MLRAVMTQRGSASKAAAVVPIAAMATVSAVRRSSTGSSPGRRRRPATGSPRSAGGSPSTSAPPARGSRAPPSASLLLDPTDQDPRVLDHLVAAVVGGDEPRVVGGQDRPRLALADLHEDLLDALC